MKLHMRNGTKVEVAKIVGIVPAKLICRDAKGRKVVVKEKDVRQIDPPLEESLPHVEG